MAAVALPQYQKAVQRTKFSQLVVAATATKKALEAYYLENEAYTTDLESLSIKTDISQFDMEIYSAGGYTAVTASFPKGVTNKVLEIVISATHQPTTLEYTKDRRECRSYRKTDAVSNGVCKNLSGKIAPDGVAALYNAYFF